MASIHEIKKWQKSRDTAPLNPSSMLPLEPGQDGFSVEIQIIFGTVYPPLLVQY